MAKTTTTIKPADKSVTPEAIEQALIGGDLSRLSSADRLTYYRQVCESLGLNPLTQPLEYITLNGKLRLYARKDCTDQLRALRGVTVEILSREVDGDCLIVHVRASMAAAGGRRHEDDCGAVNLGRLQGEARANAMMKAVTKAKRRVTLSICGLGFLDETELSHEFAQAAPEPAPEVKQVEVKALPAPTPTKPIGNNVLDRVLTYQAKLILTGLCEDGELLDALEDNLGQAWVTAPPADVEKACRAFEQGRKAAREMADQRA